MSLAQGWKVLVQSFKTGYDRIGMVMLTNLLWFFVGFGPFLIITYLPFQHPVLFVAGILGTIVTLGGATAAVNHVMNRIINREDVSVKDFKIGFRKYALRGAGITFLIILGFVVLFADLMFSITHTNQIVQLLSGIWVWAILYWYAVVQFVFPFLTQQDIGIIKTYKRAALVSVDNILGSIMIIVIALLITALSLVLAAPILLFTTSLLALIQNYTLNEIMLKYEKAEAQAEG